MQHATTTNAATTTLNYAKLRYTNCITSQYNCNCNYHYIALHYTTIITLHYNYNYTTLHYARQHYTIPQYSTQHYSTVHYTTLITPHQNYNCNYTTLIITQQYNYNSTTLTALHHTTSSSCGEVAAATIATTPKTQLQPPFGPSVDSLCHRWFTTTNLSYRFPIFETSATALCGTTGICNIYRFRTSPSYIPSHSHHNPSIFPVYSVSCHSFLYLEWFDLGFEPLTTPFGTVTVKWSPKSGNQGENIIELPSWKLFFSMISGLLYWKGWWSSMLTGMKYCWTPTPFNSHHFLYNGWAKVHRYPPVN